MLPPVVQEAIARPGRPLDPATRTFMESRFNHDFSDVRLHTDAEAAQSAEVVRADAYTVGHDVVFGADHSPLESSRGKRLLAHELAHVVQQGRGGQTPETQASATHEHDAHAAADAVVRGQQVSVTTGTGIGLTRQPKDMPAEDFASDKFLTPPKDYGISDPRSSSRYIDKLFENVTMSGFNGASTFEWIEGGKKRNAVVPLADLEQDDTKSFHPMLDIYNSKAEAMKAVKPYLTSGFKVYTFYRTPDNVIMPTTFSIHSTPNFHKLWPGLSQELEEDKADVRQGLATLANIVNPIPATKVDERGDLSVSGDPLDWLALLKLRRIKQMRKTGPRTRKLHSGYGVPYTVLGPHNKLSGTSVYVLNDAGGTVLYVGKGETLNRLREHIKDPKKTQWFGEISQVEVRATGLNNTQALALEQDLIGQLKPAHNGEKFPFNKEFGTAMEVGPNLPPAQKALQFWVEWGR